MSSNSSVQPTPVYLGIKHNFSKSASLSERLEYPREFVNEVFMSEGGSVELIDELVRGQEC